MKKFLHFNCSLLAIVGLNFISGDRFTVARDVPIAIESAQNSSTAELKIIDPGREPRQELRYQPPINSKQKVKAIFNTTNTIVSADGETKSTYSLFPDFEMVMESTVTNIDDRNNIYVEFSNIDIEIIDSSKVSPELLEVIKSNLGKRTEVKTYMAIDNLGRRTESNSNDSNQKSGFNGQNLFNLATGEHYQLPSEAVGIGAEWQIKDLTVVNNYKLLDVKDNTLTLDITTKLLEDSNPDRVSMDIEARTLAKLALDRIMPISATTDLVSTTTTKIIDPESQKETVENIQFLMKVSIESQY